jgi:hypothetical protein
VVPLDAHELEEELGMGSSSDGSSDGSSGNSNLLLNPVKSVQAWLDHHHGSYAQELEAAAVADLRERQQRKRRQQQQQQLHEERKAR